jgi:hypothetical protein
LCVAVLGAVANGPLRGCSSIIYNRRLGALVCESRLFRACSRGGMPPARRHCARAAADRPPTYGAGDIDFGTISGLVRFTLTLANGRAPLLLLLSWRDANHSPASPAGQPSKARCSEPAGNFANIESDCFGGARAARARLLRLPASDRATGDDSASQTVAVCRQTEWECARPPDRCPNWSHTHRD